MIDLRRAFGRSGPRALWLALLALAAPTVSAQEICFDNCPSWVCDTGWTWVEETCTECNWVCDTCTDCWTNCDEEGNCWDECNSYACNCRDECSSYVCGGHWDTYQTNCRWENEACNPHPCPPPPPPPEWCGDGTCNNGESCGSCEQDCGACSFCGDGTCNGGIGEDCGTCLADCPCWDPNFARCENRQCVAGPPPDPCGDGECNGAIGEDCGTCLQDCPCWDPNFPRCENRQCLAPLPSDPFCGDRNCDGSIGEDCGTCLQDCPCWDPSLPRCQNGQCVAASSGRCGDGIPDPGETCQSCPADVALRPDFTASPSTVRLGQGITFSVDAGQIVDPPVPLWDLGNGEQLTGATLSYTYPAEGTYGVVLTSTESACQTPALTGPKTVVVLPPLSCDFSDLPPELRVCCPNTTCDSGENPGNCEQDCPTVCGDHYCVNSQGETPASCPLDCCASQSSCPAGCAPLPRFAVSDSGPVIKEPVTFSASADGIVPGSAVNWDFGDTNHCVQCGLTVSHTYEEAGSMEVRLTATESVCNTSQISSVVIRVFDRAIQKGDQSVVTGATLPAVLACGATQEVTVTMRNMGNTTWTSEAGYALGAVGDSDPFSAAARIPLPGPVAPLQFVTFTFTLNGGTANGTFTTDWRMVREGVAWFGAVAQSQVVVPAAPGCGLEAFGEALDMTLHCHEQAPAQLRLHNTGTVPWTPAEDFAVTVVAGDALSDVQRIPVPHEIPPGGVHDFPFDVTGTPTAGAVTAFWRMTRGGELFGETVPQEVHVVGPGCDPPPPTGILDGGVFIRIDNLSSMTKERVEHLVVRADRSTRTDCTNTPNNKGLFKTGDRIVVTDNYIAWFDYTGNDGRAFPGDQPGDQDKALGPFDGVWERSGTLAGWWSLNDATDDFRYQRAGPNCAGWAHNELLPGSASPNGEFNFWDKYAPPVELCVAVKGGEQLDLSKFFCFHYSKEGSTWQEDSDVTDAEGLHYRTRGLLRSATGQETFDQGSITGNSIDSRVEFVSRPTDIRVIWKFKPAKNVDLDNLLAYAWVSYAQDMDPGQPPVPTSCKLQHACPPSRSPACETQSHWPGQVFEIARFTDSFKCSAVEQIPLAPACSPTGSNFDAPTCTGPGGSFDPGPGDWVRLGESANLAAGPTVRFTVLGQPGTGAGSEGNPERVDWDRIYSWNENRVDGTMGIGASSGPGLTTPLTGGRWYAAEFVLKLGPQ